MNRTCCELSAALSRPARIPRGYCRRAGLLGLPEERDQAKAVQAVKAKLQTTPGWLLVLDNAEDPATVRPYLPGTGGGRGGPRHRAAVPGGTAAFGTARAPCSRRAATRGARCRPCKRRVNNGPSAFSVRTLGGCDGDDYI